MSNSDIIFLLEGEDHLKEISQAAYETEDLLQRLLMNHPALLAGHQIDEENPPRWLLVSREMGIPDAEGGSNRWSVDHMFLDQFGVPTFVEVKRASDTRIRREVVGQMLDYAANAQKYWPVETLRLEAVKQAGSAEALDEKLVDFLDIEQGENTSEKLSGFWQNVEENMRRGRLRLLFVADRIPSELRRIIEFLNEKIPDIDVLGVELVQYQRENLRVLVPRVVGQTEAAKGSKSRRGRSGPSGPSLTADEFLSRCPETTRQFFKELFEETEERGMRGYWGSTRFSALLTTNFHDRQTTILYAGPSGVVSGADDPVLEAVFLNNSFTKEERAKNIQLLMSKAPFENAGECTIRLLINENTLSQAQDALRVLWDIEEQCRKG